MKTGDSEIKTQELREDKSLEKIESHGADSTEET